MTELAEKAVKELGVEAEIMKVTDIKEIMNYGVTFTPALAINGVVKIAGKIPSIKNKRVVKRKLIFHLRK